MPELPAISTSEASPQAAAPRARAGMAVLAIGAGAVALDTSVNVAFPAISQALQLPVSGIQWIVVTYMLTFGALMLVCGRLGDSIGHLKVFRAGLAINATALLIATFAPGIAVLVPARLLQGAGAAACISCAPALATFLYPESQRMRALGLFGALFAVAQAVGPAIGGPLVEAFGWRSVFAFRVPLAIAALVFSAHLVRRPHVSQPFHVGAAALLCLAVAALLGGLASLQWTHARPWSLAMGIIGALSLATFVRLQRTSGIVLLPRRAFADAPLLALNLLNLVINLAAFAVLLLVPYALAARGLDVVSLGLVLAVSAMATSCAAQLAPALAAQIGREALLPLGLAACTLGLFAIGGWQPDTPLLWCCLGLVLQGIGLGLFSVAYTDAVTGILPISDRGLAGGIVTASRTFGIVAGAALFSAIVARGSERNSFAAAFALSFHVAAALLLGASLVLLAWYWGAKRQRSGETTP
jgi:MFS family permease